MLWNTEKLLIIIIKHLINESSFGISWLVDWVSWHINLCRLFNAKSIFMQIVSSIFFKIQFNMSTQFNCQKHLYFKLFSLFEQF